MMRRRQARHSGKGRAGGRAWRRLWAGALVLAAPVAARGEVMEITGNGWHWVSAAPARPVAGPVAPATGAAMPMVPPRWRPMVSRLAERYDLSPAIIAALVWQESRWHEQALSPSGARGLAQLMPATARALGADARDPAANIDAGARYLHLLVGAFGGDIEKALAAYNAGPGRVERAGGVPPIAETRAYVAAILTRLAGEGR
ncbi:MAG: lytic transglycosylase domain-containing protein [Sphingomonadales bacterium]|nr:lytic transglycosylase domain-containing protein [Sphingomonadales bacterium]